MACGRFLVMIKAIKQRGMIYMAMSDHVKGKYDEAAGKTKEVVGSATGNERVEAEGKTQNLAGKARDAMGDIKEKAADAVEDLKEKMHKDSE
jgi:uncharacterized protein YjbJ (UPF0337 family)